MQKKRLTAKAKEKKRQAEISELLSEVASGDLNTLLAKVGWILNHFSSARNSDITCLIKFWKTFEPEIINNGTIKVDDLYKYTKLTSVVRARAKIQNDYKLFLASPEVRKKRGTLEDEYESWAIDEKSDFEQYSVYIDESGKTDKYIIVGSVWIIDSISTMTLFRKIMELKELEKFDQEFHFSSISENKEHIYLKLIDLLYAYSTSLCFKYCYIQNEGVNFAVAQKAMMYHLIIDGIKHENETGRAPLPRSIQIVKDAESKGSDQLLLKELKSKIEIASKLFFSQKLYLGEFRAFDSKDNFYLQIADVLVASLNRKLNYPGQMNNAKDRVADHFFSRFGLQLLDGKVESIDDLIAEISI